MDTYQFFTFLGLFGAGFGWLLYQMSELRKEISDLRKDVHRVELRIVNVETFLGIKHKDFSAKTGTE